MGNFKVTQTHYENWPEKGCMSQSIESYETSKKSLKFKDDHFEFLHFSGKYKIHDIQNAENPNNPLAERGF